MSDAAICPACVGIPPHVTANAAQGSAPQQISLSLPAIHCINCITGVESVLHDQPGVKSARVNLTRKRADIACDAWVDADDLAASVINQGYEAHVLDPALDARGDASSEGRALLLRLGVAGFAMMNVMLLSVAVWAGASDVTRDMFHLISAVIAIPAVGYAAVPFFRSAARALLARRVNMDVPISLALLLAIGMSLFEVRQSGQHAYFDAALSLTFFLLIGRFLDHRARLFARSAADELAALEPRQAIRVTDAGDEKVQLDHLKIGDQVRILQGNRVAVDGTIVSGHSDMDCAAITGEPMPVSAGPGDTVTAGAIALNGALIIKLSTDGTHTSLQQLRDIVQSGERVRSRYTSLADKAARIYVPLVHTLSLAAFVGWYLATGDLRVSINTAVAVLIITCPCALGLAIPAVSTVATGKLFRAGILIKSATALECLSKATSVVFDKTGTLTKGTLQVCEDQPITPHQWALAAALSTGSAHPMAQAISTFCTENGIKPANVTSVTETPGTGISAQLGYATVRMGRGMWMGQSQIAGLATWLDDGHGTIVPIVFRDELKPNASQAIATLNRWGIKSALLSGDTEQNVAAVANATNVTTSVSSVKPAEKANWIATTIENGDLPLMIGDGLNDTAALSGAYVSASPASAVDASRAASDVVLLNQDLNAVPQMVSVAKQARRRMVENLALAAIYNAIAIPLAVFGFVTPLIAAIAMSGSSIIVSLNALRIRSEL
jgi:Cu2+-exporting ATPase